MGFAPENARRISYAASFGKSYPLSQGEAEVFSERLSHFDAISLREDDGVDIVRQCGHQGIHVCDPTLLLSREQWSGFASSVRLKEKYILVYVMDYGYHELLDNAVILALEGQLKLHVVSFSKIDDPRIDRCFCKCTPRDFVALVMNAEMVVTNSFHGTAFATVFRKPMLILGKRNYNSRMLSVLKKAGLLDRFVNFGTVIGKEDAQRFLAPLDREAVDAALGQWIDDSKTFLQEQLSKE